MASTEQLAVMALSFALFNLFDTDGSGFVNRAKIISALEKVEGNRDQAMELADLGEKISANEFFEHYRKT
eukprot:1570456-Rhodomonas_salina.1